MKNPQIITLATTHDRNRIHFLFTSDHSSSDELPSGQTVEYRAREMAELSYDASRYTMKKKRRPQLQKLDCVGVEQLKMLVFFLGLTIRSWELSLSQ